MSWWGNITPALTSHHCLHSLSLSPQPKDKLTQNVNKFWNSSGNLENWKTYQLSFETEGKNQIELKEENKTVRSFIWSFLYSRYFHFRTFYILYFTSKLGPGWKKVQQSVNLRQFCLLLNLIQSLTSIRSPLPGSKYQMCQLSAS